MATSSVFDRLPSVRRTMRAGVPPKIRIVYRSNATHLLKKLVRRASAPRKLGIATDDWWSCSEGKYRPAPWSYETPSC